MREAGYICIYVYTEKKKVQFLFKENNETQFSLARFPRDGEN